MAIVSVKPITDGQQGGVTDTLAREYTHCYRVVTDSLLTGEVEVAYGPLIPWMYSSHPTDLLSVVVKKSADRDPQAPLCWVVKVEYSTRAAQAPIDGGTEGGDDPAKPGGGGESDNPELQPPDVDWDIETETRPLRWALPATSGGGRVPVVNSAGEPFDPLPEYKIGYPVLTVSRNELGYNAQAAAGYSYAVNSDTFLFAQPGQALMMPIKAKRVYAKRVAYWRVTYRVAFYWDPLADWQPSVLDAGYKETDPSGTAGKPLVPILDGHKQPVNAPWPLSGGHAMTPDQIKAGSVNYIRFVAYKSVAFNPLGLQYS